MNARGVIVVVFVFFLFCRARVAYRAEIWASVGLGVEACCCDDAAADDDDDDDDDDDASAA